MDRDILNTGRYVLKLKPHNMMPADRCYQVLSTKQAIRMRARGTGGCALGGMAGGGSGVGGRGGEGSQ